ncbi:MAG: cyclic pyranopterin phosphate synthase MoaA, partial [Bacteroidota bacterium]|nr:cyclic pyranopterin phosphate synthase MoaA [Bacteroidota bacterium]
MDVKINTVVMDGKNTQDIISLVQLTKELPVSVRFIEEMPFNGDGHQHSGIQWNYVQILDTIKSHFPLLNKIQDAPFSTSLNYNIPGHKGNVGIIAAYTRSFCGSCNRIRITPKGLLKTCLYDNGLFNLKDMLRNGNTTTEIEQALNSALGTRHRNGWEAEKTTAQQTLHQSMAAIGG